MDRDNTALQIDMSESPDCSRRNPDAGAFHRRKHGDLFDSERAHAEEPAVCASRADGHDLHTDRRRCEASDERHKLNGEQRELLRDNVPALMAAISSPRTSGVNLGVGSQGRYLHAGRVSAHYFDVLAIQPLVGRNFSEDEDRPHGPKAGMLSYSLWRNTLSANPDIVGQAIRLKGEPYVCLMVRLRR